MKPFKSLFILLIAAIATPLAAQVVTSPYSKFGYGLLGDNATSSQRQMGGTGYAMQSGRQINAMNPASYAAVDSMTFLFDMGVNASAYIRKDGDVTDRDLSGGLDYITMQIPLAKNLGLSAGVLPFSSVGYNFGSDISNGSTAYSGIGGINQLYLGTGWRPFKGFSIGVNASWLFGNVVNDVDATNTGGSQAVFEQVMEIHDYRFRFGAQYRLPLTDKHSLTLGLTYDPAKALLGNTYVVKYLQTSSEVVKPDTVGGLQSMRGRFSLPDSYGAGLAYDFDNRIHVEGDFTYQNWAEAKFMQDTNFSETKLANRWRAGLGASYQPDPRGSYFKRMTYRAGAFYNRDYITVNGNNVRDFGISAGVGFPVISAKSQINLGFEYLNRQATPNPLLKENYFTVTLGVNFNQVWFYHNKLR